MSLSAKIELENKIFARAARLQTEVYSKYGRLSSPSEDLELQTLLYVYNAHFCAKNFRQFCSSREALQAYQTYHSQGHDQAGLTPVLGKEELAFELILSEEE